MSVNDDEILPLGQKSKKKRIVVSKEVKIEIENFCRLNYSTIDKDLPRGYPALINAKFKIKTGWSYCDRFLKKMKGESTKKVPYNSTRRKHRATGNKPTGRTGTFSKEENLNAFNFIGQRFANMYIVIRPCDMQFNLRYDHKIRVSRRTISHHLNYNLHATIAKMKFVKEFVRDPVTVPKMKIFSFGERQDFSDFQDVFYDYLPQLCAHGNLSTTCPECVAIVEETVAVVDLAGDEDLHAEIVLNPRGEITHVYDRDYNAIPLFSQKNFHPDAEFLWSGTRVLLWDDIGPPTASLCHTYKNDCVELKPLYDPKVFLYYPHIDYEVIHCKCPDCYKETVAVEERKETQRVLFNNYLLSRNPETLVTSEDSEGVEVHRVGVRERRVVLDDDGRVLFDCVV